MTRIHEAGSTFGTAMSDDEVSKPPLVLIAEATFLLLFAMHSF